MAHPCFTKGLRLGLSQKPTVLLRENAHQIDNCIYGKEARHTNICHLSRQVVHVHHLLQVGDSQACDTNWLSFLLRFPSMPTNCHFCYLLLDYEFYIDSYNRIWKLFTLLQPAPVVLGLFTKRRECWGLTLLEGMGRFHGNLFLESDHYDRGWTVLNADSWIFDELQQLRQTVCQM